MKKSKHFYSELVTFETLHIELSGLDLTEKEKEELVSIAETNVHHVILDRVLSELPENEKKQFLTHLMKDDHAGIWNLIRTHSQDIEQKIQHAAVEALQSLQQDIIDLKNKMK